jgi:hypothetical protein
MAFRAPIGMSDFSKLRTANAAYVDKTAAIVQILDTPSEVFLFTRPRRFGKTLFLSTLAAWLERADLRGEDTTALFSDLAVWRSEAARAHHQRYPVVSLSLKDLAAPTWEGMVHLLGEVMAGAVDDAFRRCAGTNFGEGAGGQLQLIQQRQASVHQLSTGLPNLVSELYRVTGERVVVLIDEYDSPLHQAWTNGYYEQAIPFLRTMLGMTLKDNRSLAFGVLTGVLRVARESMFSGFNNISVNTVRSRDFTDTFGFTQREVEALAAQAGVEDRLADIEAWYNGYLFGGAPIYNPWSVLSFLRQPADGLQPYWANSGGTALIGQLIEQTEPDLWMALEDLYRGEPVSVEVSENLVFADLETDTAALWSLLLAAGYVKPIHLDGDDMELVIPNREVRHSWGLLLARRMRSSMGHSLDRLLRALLEGDGPTFEDGLRRVAAKVMSFHDTGGSHPERVWQAFVLGLLVYLEPEYEVRSNLEAGYGRADVLIRPRQAGRPGVVMELKRLEEGEDVATAMEAAFQQIADKGYVLALAEVAAPVRRVAAVFAGKKVHAQFR